MSTPTRDVTTRETTYGTTVRAVIAESLCAAARTSDTKAPPLTVLWPDPNRVWESAIRSLQEALPILVLGDWTCEDVSAQGPALWIRAVLAAPDVVPLPDRLPARDSEHPEKTPWVIYLPGVHRNELIDLAQIPQHLAPLADIALRSTWWTSPSNQVPWTPHSFLTSKYGAHLDLAGDAATRQALTEVLPRFLDEDVDALRHQGRIDASRLHARVIPDAVRALLDWINDPTATRARLTEAEWLAFSHSCRNTFGIDPTKDTHLTAARHLGARGGEWDTVWQRFAETAHRYTGIHAALDQARPQSDLLGGDDPHPDSWPSWNREQEDLLRSALTALATPPDASAVRDRIRVLASEHAPRRESVWGELGYAPLAHAVALLGRLVDAMTDLTGRSIAEAVTWYAEQGYVIDHFAIEARASVAQSIDREPVLTALHTVYDPWADETARTFQRLTKSGGYAGETGLSVAPGTCVVYVDALRLDLAHRLADRLGPRNVALDHRLAAFPTLTPTGQPAIAPVAEATRAAWGAGPDFDAGDAQGRSLKGQVLRKSLAESGVQFLAWDENETGETTGIAWTQTNDIDSAGHAGKGARFEDVIDGLLDQVATRIDSLLNAGWRQVLVVTDHGFLLPARPAHKVELPLALTEGGGARKPRVARLREGAPAQQLPVVPWTWDPSISMISAPGAAAFEDGVTYDHGGLSPQECVIPVLTVTSLNASGIEGALAGAFSAQIAASRWTGMRCRIDVTPALAGITAELRLSPGDPTTRISGPVTTNDDGEAKLLVADDTHEGAAAHVVVLDSAGTVTAQHETTVGGDR